MLQGDSKNSNIRFPSNEKNQAKDCRNKSCEGTLISLNISGKGIADAVQRALHKQNGYNHEMKEFLVKHSKFEMTNYNINIFNQQEALK